MDNRAEVREFLMSRRAKITPARAGIVAGAVAGGAPLGGHIADATSLRTALWTGIAGLIASAAVLTASPFRHATVPGPATPR